MAHDRRGADEDELADIEALEKDGIDASDEAVAELRAGRYGSLVGERPGIGVRILHEGLRPVRWRRHHQGWSCRRCGLDARTGTFLGRHDRFHYWLDKTFAWIGRDLDRIEGELEALREEIVDVRQECAERCQAAEHKADLATARLDQMAALLGPILAKAYPTEPEQATATVTVEDRNAKAPVTATD